MVLRTTITIVLFSMGIIYLVGSALYTQINSGIYKEKVNASIYDAQSIARSTQIQLIYARYRSEKEIPKVFSGLLADPTLNGVNSGRALAIFPSNKLTGKLKFTGTSNTLLPASIPDSFRKLNQKATSTQSIKTKLFFQDSPSKNGLIVGHNLTLEGLGKYEFYVAYSFDRQEFTMGLIRTALLIAEIGRAHV